MFLLATSYRRLLATTSESAGGYGIDDVRDTLAARDQGWTPIDHPVVDLTRILVACRVGNQKRVPHSYASTLRGPVAPAMRTIPVPTVDDGYRPQRVK